MSKVCPTCGTNYSDGNAFCPADGTTLRAAEIGASLIGNVVADRYLVTELLGEGGMGKVYLARHVRLPRDAAIKILHPSMVRDPAAVSRFNREASNASRIEHEAVARVFDFGETNDGLVYLAMEYVPGRTLKQLLAQDGPLPMPQTVSLVRQIAAGLDAAHRLQIVHRDLKPDNILVRNDTSDGLQCKIVDFGIAKAVGAGEKALTRTGFVVGTPEYMSPEQLLGEDIDHRSDVYALALVAYRCLTGDTPFDSNTADRGMMARLMNEPRPLAVVRPEMSWSDAVQAVIVEGLERDPAKRPASAGAFARALTEAAVAEAPAAPKAPAAKAPPAVAAKAAAKKTPPAAAAVTTPPAAVAVQTPPRGIEPLPPAARSASPSSPTPPLSPMSSGAAHPYHPGWSGQGPPVYIPVHVPAPPPAPSVSATRQAPWRLRLPRFSIERTIMLVAVLGFAWLVVSEGSVKGAVREVKKMARNAQVAVMRFVK